MALARYVVPGSNGVRKSEAAAAGTCGTCQRRRTEQRVLTSSWRHGVLRICIAAFACREVSMSSSSHSTGEKTHHVSYHRSLLRSRVLHRSICRCSRPHQLLPPIPHDLSRRITIPQRQDTSTSISSSSVPDSDWRLTCLRSVPSGQGIARLL